MPQQIDKRCLRHAAVLGLTLVLTFFCGHGDTKEVSEDVLQFNTTLNQLFIGTGQEPKVLAIQRPCGPKHDGFCVNGVCSFSTDFDAPVCRCHKTYTGARCEIILLDTQSYSSHEEVIGISCGVVLLLGTLLGLLYCFLKKRCRKSSPPYKNYGSENSV